MLYRDMHMMHARRWFQPIPALTYYTTVRWILGIVNTKPHARSRLLRRVACVFSSQVWVYNRSKRRSYTFRRYATTRTQHGRFLDGRIRH
jgi:hypothetical protein